MDDRKALLIGCGVGLLLVVCLGCLVAFGGIAYGVAEVVRQADGEFSFDTSPGTPTTPPEIVRPAEDVMEQTTLGRETLTTLQQVEVPSNDPTDLAWRLAGIPDIPETLPDLQAPHAVGEQQQFWVTNISTNLSSQTSATLQYVTEHLYFWVGDDVTYDDEDLARIANTFENDIYPTNRDFFGSEWSPGIDEDPHIYILYVRGIGGGTAGYFSAADALHPLAHEYSNAHETFVINADNSPLGSEFTYGVLAHEFQHMIHWYADRNESSWINEGFSEVASMLNDYDPGGFDYSFISNPDYQLNDWPNDGNTASSYGAAFLYLAYFLDQQGEAATQRLVAHPENGLQSIDLVLEELNVTDPLSGAPVRADDVFVDWALTNYLQDDDIGDGRYGYIRHQTAPQAFETETISECLPGKQRRDVHQYGTDYIRINCAGQHTLRFEGSVLTKLLPEDAYSGSFSFWSNKGDESDMTLTRRFDFTDHSGPLTFSYWTWYDIEEDYDYVYLVASEDGESWEILTTPSGTGEDPSGNSYGWGYNGLSDGDLSWIQEQVDISDYAGKEVFLRFEYVTDAAVNGEGLLLDDVSIPEIDYFSDFEEDQGGWDGSGFVRVANELPQTFRLALISVGQETSVEYLELDPDMGLDIPLDIGGEVEEVVLVVMGMTRFTRQLAGYTLDFLP